MQQYSFTKWVFKEVSTNLLELFQIQFNRITRNDFISALICPQTTKVPHFERTILSSMFYSEKGGKKAEEKKTEI